MQRGSTKNRVLDYWVGVPLLNLLVTGRRNRKMPARIRRVGVICSPALGDTLLFSSVLQDLRRYFSPPHRGAEIVHFCMHSNLAAAELLEGADRRVFIDLTNPPSTIKKLRDEALDLLLDFTSWQRLTAFYSLTSSAQFVVGFDTPGQHRSRGYDLAVPHRSDRHEVDNFRAILHAIHIPTGALPQVCLTGALLKTPDPMESIPDLVVFHLWASGQRGALREWPEDRWMELAHRLSQSDTVFAITGSPEDLPRTDRFVQRMRDAGLTAVPFSGSDGFRSLARMLSRARLVVTVNTGVMHLAAVIGAPTVAINGPNRNGRWGPVGPRAIGVESPGPGCGFLHLGFDFDGRATDCMERITVALVMDAIDVLTVSTMTTAFGVLLQA